MPGRKKAARAPASDPDPRILEQASEALAHIRTLWRDLFRSPFAEAEEHGLTGPQVTVMAHVVRHGPTTLTELSRALGMSHSTASGIVDRLQARGLLRRTRDPKDRRRTAIEVTDEVSQYVRELELGPAGRLAAALASATAEQRRLVREGLKTLRALLDQRLDENSANASARPDPSRRSPSPRKTDS